MKIYLDINQFGEPHWLGPLAQFDPTTIREYNRQRWVDAQKAKLAAAQAARKVRVLGDAGFDPNQERDENGRWTRTGQTNLGNKADWLRQKIDKMADDLGYPKDKIFMSDNIRKFSLNGKEYTSGGCAVGATEGFTDTDGVHYEKGDIVVYGLEGTGFDLDMPIGSVVAHEIEHQRYREVMDAAHRESDLASIKWNSSNPFEGATKEAASKKYPIAAAIEATGIWNFAGSHELAKTDGVTDYSKAYWEAHAKNEVPWDLAVNETLAEIASLDYYGNLRNPPASISFDDFQNFVLSDFKRQYEQRGERMATPEEYESIMADPFAYADMVDRGEFQKRFGVPFDELAWNARNRTVEIPDYNNETSKRVLSPAWRKLYDTINEQYKKLKQVHDAGFDEDQPRDKDGQWAKTGALKLGTKMRTTNRSDWDSTKGALGLYKGAYINPMNDKEFIWAWEDDNGEQIMAMLEMGSSLDPQTMHLQHIRTYPQRKGAGRLAMEKLKSYAAERGLGISLDVARNSETPFKALRKFYSSLGFKGKGDSMIWKPEN